MFPTPMAHDQNKKSYKSTLYEAMFYQNTDEENYEADTEDDFDSEGGCSGGESGSEPSSRASDGCRSTSLSSRSGGGWKSVSQRTLLSQRSHNRSSTSCVSRKALVSSAVALENKLKGIIYM